VAAVAATLLLRAPRPAPAA